MIVYSSFIHKCQNLEPTKMSSSVGEWINSGTHPDNGILFSFKKKGTIKP